MALQIEGFSGAGNATAAGIFIPVADLPTLSGAEIGAANTATLEAKFALSVLTKMVAVLNSADFVNLGFTISQGNPAGVGANIFNTTFTVGWQKLVNLNDDVILPVPVPITGANSGVGDFFFTDVFADAVKVAAAGPVTGAGVVLATAGLLPYMSASHATLNLVADCRLMFSALADHLTDATVRSASVASGVTTATAGAIASTPIPAAYYAANDPTAGVDAANLKSLGLITRTDSITIQQLIDPLTQVHEVRVVTA